MYPSHRVHRYRRVRAVCLPAVTAETQSMLSLDVSWTTCRYVCDTERQRPCIGFTYRSSTPLHQRAVNSTSQPRCVLISTVCELVKPGPTDRATTYIKGPLRTGS